MPEANVLVRKHNMHGDFLTSYFETIQHNNLDNEIDTPIEMGQTFICSWSCVFL